MQRWQRLVSAFITSVCLLHTAVAPIVALEVPPAPSEKPVVDLTKTLSEGQIAALSQRIADERAASGNQLAILLIPSLEGESIEEYALEVARGWGIGEQEKDNGILLLIAKNDRQLRIEVGYGLEGDLTDAQSNRIIRNTMTPAFRQDRYFEGIEAGLKEIISAIHNENGAMANSAASVSDMGGWLPFLFIVPVWLGSILGRTKSWWAGGVLGAIAGLGIGAFASSLLTGLLATIGLAIVGTVFDWVVSRNYQQHAGSGTSPSWWAGGTRMGGFGGRSGGGFGGGGFGGGGSSGRW